MSDLEKYLFEDKTCCWIKGKTKRHFDFSLGLSKKGNVTESWSNVQSVEVTDEAKLKYTGA